MTLDLLTGLTWFNALAFVYFGFSCFYSEFIKSEFKRYGLAKYRQLTGGLQLAGAAGLLGGLYLSPLLYLLAATGLFLLMLMGFMVRLKIKDNILQSSPSLVFAILNLFIAFKVLTKYFL